MSYHEEQMKKALKQNKCDKIPQWIINIYHGLEFDTLQVCAETGRLWHAPNYKDLLKKAAFLIYHLRQANIKSTGGFTANDLALMFSVDYYNAIRNIENTDS